MTEVKVGDVVIFHPWHSGELGKFVVLRVHPTSVDLGYPGHTYHEDYNRREYLAKKSNLFAFEPELWEKIQQAAAELREKQNALLKLRNELKPLVPELKNVG